MIAAILAAPLATAQEQSQGEQPKQTQQATPDRDQTGDIRVPPIENHITIIIPEKDKLSTGIYAPDCQQPKDHDEADLCEQRRMAKAAEDATAWARKQTWIALSGIILVFFTLVATGWAAWAATRAAGYTKTSAEAASQANKTMRENAKRELRAYVSVEPDGISERIPRTEVVARVKFHNTGAIFAKNVSTFVTHKLSADGELPIGSFPIGELGGDNVIGPGADFLYATEAISKADIDAGRSKDKVLYLYVWGMAHYHDGFVGGRWTKFCHRYNFAGVKARKYIVPVENYRYHQAGNQIDDLP